MTPPRAPSNLFTRCARDRWEGAGARAELQI